MPAAASTSALTRSLSAGRGWTLAPTNSFLFSSSFDAIGKSRFFRRALREIVATSSCCACTTGSFPFFESRRILFASSSVHPSLATVSSVVITSDTSVSRSFTRM